MSETFFHHIFICFSILLLILLGNTVVMSQCYESYTYGKKIYNEPDFWVSSHTKVETSDNGELMIVFDTKVIPFYEENPRILKNKNFTIAKIDSADGVHLWIKNLASQRSYYLGFNTNHYAEYFDLGNCYIAFNTLVDNERKIAVFDYSSSSVTFYNLKARWPIGYNDTCVFIAPGDFKFQKKKYRSGSIISLNENGIQIIKSEFKKYRHFDINCIFYSNTYKVYQRFVEYVESDCSRETLVAVTITYNDKVIDSFLVRQTSFYKPRISVRNDVLKGYFGSNSITNSSNEFYRKYNKTELIEEWRQSDWVDSIPILLNSDFSSYASDRMMLLKVKLRSKDNRGLKQIDGNIYTLNGVILKEESDYYHIVLAFDIKQNQFLGYPKIVFSDSLE